MSVTGDQVVVGLRRTPLLSIAEMTAALDADRSAHGIYAWWLINADALPGVPTTPHPLEPIGLLYIGIGPGRAGSKRTLLERFGDHSRDTGHSTLRQGLASFLYKREGWRLRWTDRALLSETHNSALTVWMTTNLRVQWVSVREPWKLETTIVHEMRPPLNRSHNKSHPFYKQVGDSRKRFREAAEGNRR